MHTVASEVELPTDQLQAELERRAVPGFTGQVTIWLRVKPEAAASVWFTTEEREVKVAGKQRCISPPFDGANPPTERQMKVRAEIARERHRFRLAVSLSKVIGDFVDGDLRKIELISVRDRWQQ
jgi:hypothetical protein